jgi:hypothetical protein
MPLLLAWEMSIDTPLSPFQRQESNEMAEGEVH